MGINNLKSYRLSAGLKAELNHRHKSHGFTSRSIQINWHKIPYKTIGIFAGVFTVIIFSYMGLKSLYELQVAKAEKTRQSQQQTYEQHIASVKTELTSKSGDAEGFVALSEQYLKNKDIERAEVAAALAVEKNPLWRDGFINQGHVLLVAGKFDQAKTAFLKSLAIDPLCGQAHYLLSLTYQELKDNNLAKIEFAKAKQFGFETEIGG